ncbi:IPP transferase-domain-containing protein [Lipomyces orientalis]|uniref:IPP transferase-domain-containing protein n=1 Tax=Lipomyces orientalis TaxID=1233043 RepID=A0ACC3TVU2_9ASCO
MASTPSIVSPPTMRLPKPNLIAIIGTTGVGKSKLSVALARRLNGEIINGDSMQMYHGLDTITNKHPIPERHGIPHHLLGHITDRSYEYGLPQFEHEAAEVVDDIHARGKVPILVGGTHYYIQSFLIRNTTVAGSSPSKDLTEGQVQFLDECDTNELFAKLKEVDPLIASKFHPRDRRKLRRALEICWTTGRKTSDIYAEQKQRSQTQETGPVRYRTLVFWVWSKLDALNPRLQGRVDDMVNKGNLLQEVKEMSELYLSLDPEPELDRGIWQVIGFKEFLPYIESGKVEDREKGLEDMKRATVKYATTQIRWIKRKWLAAAAGAGNDITTVLLDASDLSMWDEKVERPATEIASQFLSGQEIELARLVPAGLEDMVQPAQESDNSARPEAWKHYECDICKDEGEKFVCVGEERWTVHLRSRRHRQSLKHLKEREAYERWKASLVAKLDEQST